MVGKATRYVTPARVAHRTRGVREPEHVCKLFVRKPGDPRCDRLQSTVGPVGEGQRPDARHVRAWEVGRRNIIDEANEQRCTTRDKRPTTGGVRGEKSFGRGEPCSDGRDRHTAAGSSVDRTEQGTRSSEAGKEFKTVVGTPQGAVSPSLASIYLHYVLDFSVFTRINVSASDLMQEPSAVVQHAWDLCGGCGVTRIPTAT